VLVLALFAAGAVAQTKQPANYDESKVGTYTLPDVLKLQNGEPVSDTQTWYQRRRAEILRLFEENVYGRSAGRPKDMSFEVFDTDRKALGGKAIRKQVRIYFSIDKNGPSEDVLLYLPANASGPVPLILTLNFSGNQSVIDDPAVRLAMLWDRKEKTKREASPESRGASKDFRGVVEKWIARGYGFATVYYCDIEPDSIDGAQLGVRTLLAKPGSEHAPNDWGAIAAWGWGLSRAMDYAETDKEIDASRVAILGHSRLGKTVLWAGARDDRFAMVLANCSGEGGASLARRNYGETVKNMNVNFPYQFAVNYQKYGDHVDQLPVDTHELLALIAPRPLYLATAEEDQWADPRGEFLAAVAAGPVYKLLGKRGLETELMPAVNQSIMHDIGFHERSGKHEITAFDWDHYMTFADMHLQKQPYTTVLPGKGLDQHPFLYCGEWQNRGRTEQTMYVVRGGKITWSYSIPSREELGDCSMLSNGNIVFSRRWGASEITPDKKIVWNYKARPNTEIHTTQPIDKDRVLVVENGNPAKLLIVNKVMGKTEKEMVLQTGKPENAHGHFRHVRMTPAGMFLVPHMDMGKVVEYDQNGKEIWSVAAASPWAAVRLKNGNTLISGNQHGYVREVNGKGETVWEINKNDLPGMPLYTVQEADRLPNGNTIICNWSGSLPFAAWPTVVQVIEVTPEKKVVWALRDWEHLGPATAIQILDEKGVAEKRELQR
jgi:hypothetical protein